MRKLLAICLLTVFTLWCHSDFAQGQDATETGDQQQSAKPSKESNSKDQHDTPLQPYRLDFSFNEMENGKTINSRHYSLNVTAGRSDEVKIGTRVPVAAGETKTTAGQFQYLDLGTNIWAALRDHSGELELDVRAETSSTKHEDVDVYPRAPHSTFTPPIIRQISITGSTLLVTSKRLVIGTVDDPYSNRQFQLEVTASKLR